MTPNDRSGCDLTLRTLVILSLVSDHCSQSDDETHACVGELPIPKPTALLSNDFGDAHDSSAVGLG